jgi:hypothetical protein
MEQSPQKLEATQSVYKFPAFCGTRTFTTTFTKPATGPYNKPHESDPTLTPCSLKIHFNIILSWNEVLQNLSQEEMLKYKFKWPFGPFCQADPASKLEIFKSRFSDYFVKFTLSRRKIHNNIYYYFLNFGLSPSSPCFKTTTFLGMALPSSSGAPTLVGLVDGASLYRWTFRDEW